LKSHIIKVLARRMSRMQSTWREYSLKYCLSFNSYSQI
jgi:hypothetical protein